MNRQIKNRLSALERASHRRFDEITLEPRDKLPTRAELEQLRVELQIPDAVFIDLFGDQLRDLP